MKFFLILFIATILIQDLRSQNIDSIAVGIGKRNDNGGPWQFDALRIDSFSSQKLIYSVSRQWLNNSWVNEYLTHYTYIGNEVSERLNQNWNFTQWENKSKIIYSNSNPDSITTQQWVTGWATSKLEVHLINTIGLDSIIINSNWQFNSWVNAKKTEYTYNPDSSFNSELVSSPDSISQWRNFSLTHWFKDSLQRDTSIEVQRFTTGVWENYKRTLLSYDSLGRVIYKERSYWDDTYGWSFLVYNTETIVYDSLNRVISVHDNDIPGGGGSSYYNYDSAGINYETNSKGYDNSGDETYYNFRWYFYPLNNSMSMSIFTSGDFSICREESLHIGVFVIGGQQPLVYSWSPSAGLVSDIIENPIVITDSSTTYILTVTDSNNVSVSDTVNVEVYPSPTISNIQAFNTSCLGCNDGMFILTGTGGTSSYIDYSISPNPGAYIGLDFIAGLPAGIYNICGSNSEECTICISDTIFDSGVFVLENQINKIFLHPNPFQTITHLYFDSIKSPIHLTLYNSKGILIRNYIVEESRISIYKDEMPAGIYFGVAKASDGVTTTFKLIAVD